MSTEISLKGTERKVFNATFQDGLVDIGIGGFLLTFAYGPYLGTYLNDFLATIVAYLPIWVILFPALSIIRKYIVTPRVGIVKYGPWRVSRLARYNAVMFIALVFSLILGILSVVRFDAVPGWVHTARLSLMFLLAFSIAGYFLDVTRFYIYGVMIAFAPLIGEVLYQYMGVPHHGWPVTFGISGVLLIITGLFLFQQFMRNHPLPTADAETIERGE